MGCGREGVGEGGGRGKRSDQLATLLKWEKWMRMAFQLTTHPHPHSNIFPLPQN